MRRTDLILSVAFAALLSATATAAQAQDTANRGGAQAKDSDDIIVTATRRDESLRDVPMSISAYSQETLDKQGVKDVADIARLTPNITFNKTGGLGSTISMRGISSTAGAATVGVYIDDTPIAQRSTIASGNFSSNAYPKLFDLQRVEVLRGPQGTLFGASSEGGAIRFITPEPGLSDYSFYGRAGISDTEGGATSFESGVAAGGPIVQDKLGFRASVWTRRDGGYVDRLNPYTGAVAVSNANEQRTIAARFALKWQATDTLAITPSVFYQKIKLDDTATVFPSVITNPAYTYLNYTDVNKNRFGQGYSQPQWAKQNFVLPALKIEYNGDGFDVVSNTSYYRRRENSITDFTPFETPLWTGLFTGVPVPLPLSPADKATGTDEQNSSFFTQELRVQNNQPDATVNWTVGAFYSKNKVETFRSVENTFLGGLLQAAGIPCATPNDCLTAAFGVAPAQGRYLFVGNTTTWDTQLSAYANVDINITPKLKLIAGVRISKTKYEFENFADGPVNGPPAPRTDLGSSKETPITPKVGITYTADNGNLYYATISDGFRTGGANVPIYNLGCDVAAVGGVPATYKSDRVRNYEAGAKVSFLDNRVTVDGGAFLIKWKDRITNISIPPGACPLSFTDNVSDLTSYGFDIAVRVRPVKGLSISAAVGDANATYDDDYFKVATQAKPTVSAGDAISGSHTTFTLSGEYEYDLGGENSLYARGDWSYSGPNDRTSDLNPDNAGYDPTAPNEPDKSMSIINVRAGTRIGGLDLSVFVDNLFDKNRLYDFGAVGFGSPIHSGFLSNRPRTAGLTLSAHY